jgi:hypothetical protein
VAATSLPQSQGDEPLLASTDNVNEVLDEVNEECHQDAIPNAIKNTTQNAMSNSDFGLDSLLWLFLET